ncbi:MULTISPECIES: ABC-2 family transporter protein [unclassified Nocardia]|uniref:ABC transporter permease n=1 Tax=unclassified Nocardia TaxID=2637762 RepID=UPI0024A9B3F3|nr:MULTISPECIES: ABC-2 family transporter protein [unclassified Nocardia]
MRADVGIYWQLVRAGFRRQSYYRSAMVAGLITNVVFGFVRAAVLMTAVNSGSEFGGYDQGTIGAYTWLSQGLLGAIAFWGVPNIVERIKSGDVAIDFLRPIDIQLAHLAEYCGRAVYTLLPRGLPSVLIGALTFGLAVPATPGPYLLGAISLVLAIAVSFLSLFTVCLAGFWVVETRGLRTLHMILGTFLAGLFAPVHLFPEWLRILAYCTPFPSMLQWPIDVLSGRTVGWHAVGLVGAQLCWLFALLAAGQLVLRAGQRKLEVQGG